MAKILIQAEMAKEIYVCGICQFAYETKELAQECENWCRNHNSCSLEITKSSIGVLKTMK